MATTISFGNVFDVANGGVNTKEETYVAGPSLLTSTTPYVDYRFNNLTDYSGREKTLLETGVAGASIFTSNGPTTGDGYIQVPVGNTVSTNIAPTTQFITIANAAGSGTGMIISFDMKFNGSVPTGDGYVFTLGTPRNAGTGDSAASVGLNFRILDSKFKLSLTSITGATVTIDYNYANYTLVTDTWIRVDVRVPKTLTSSSVTMGLYINGTLMTPSVVDNATPSLVISYNGGALNNNLLKFYERGTTQLSNFKIWLSDNLNVLATVPTTITPIVDYKFYDAVDLTTTNVSSAIWNGSLTDSSGNGGGNLTYYSGTEASPITGVLDKRYINFGTAIYTSTVAQFTNIGEASFSFWINPTSATLTNINKMIFSWSNSVVRIHIINNLLYMWSNGGFSTPFNSTLFPSNRWTHVTIVSSNTSFNSCKIYYNGVSQTVTTSITSSGIVFPTTVTVRGISSSFLFSDIRFFNRLLTQDDVTTIFRNQEYLRVPENTTGAVRIQSATIAKNDGTGSGMVLSFDMKLNNTLTTVETPIFTIGTRPKITDAGVATWVTSSLASKGFVVRYIAGYLSCAFVDAFGNFTIYNHTASPANAFSTTAWTRVDIKIPKDITTGTVEVYINGELVTTSFQGSSTALEFSSTYDSSLVKTFPTAPVDAPSVTTKQQYLDWFKNISTVMQNVTPNTLSYKNLGAPVVGTVNSGRSVMLADGRILILSTSSTATSTPRLYTPINDGASIGTVIESRGIIGTDLNKYGKGILMKDGRVVFMPNATFKFCIYTPDYVTLTNPGTYNLASTPDASPDNGVTNAGYSGGALLPDGRVVCVPLGASNIGIYTPDTGVGSFTRAGPTATGYSSCTLLPDGRVFFVPKGAPRIGLYTPGIAPEVGTFNNTTTPLATNYDGCILLLDGRVLLISNTSSVKLGIYTPDYTNITGVGAFDNSLTPVLPSYTGTINACLLPGGSVLIYRFLINLTDATMWSGIYTPNSGGGTFTFSYPFTSTVRAGANQVGDCNITSDGRLIFTPSGLGSILAVTGSYPTSREFCIRPFSRSM